MPTRGGPPSSNLRGEGHAKRAKTTNHSVPTGPARREEPIVKYFEIGLLDRMYCLMFAHHVDVVAVYKGQRITECMLPALLDIDEDL